MQPAANNAKRLLLVPASNNNTEKCLSGDFSAPTDSANMVAVSVHYYEPPTFCVAEIGSSWGYTSTWGTNADYTLLEANLDKLEDKFIDKGIPVIIGEYGVVTNEGKMMLPSRSSSRRLHPIPMARTVCVRFCGMIPTPAP